MKKIIKLLLIILSLTLLVSCLGYIGKENYESNNLYEQKIIETSKSLDKNTVALTNSGSAVGSAVIIEEKRQGLDYLYYAVTLKENIEPELPDVYVNRTNDNITIKDTYVNDTYNIAIITFSIKTRLGVAKVLDNDKVRDIFVGQSILSVGTDSRMEIINSVKLGTISSINSTTFTHDAANNHGELGSGIYDLDGYLVGINLSKTYFNTTSQGQENVLGLNYAISVKLIGKLLLELNNLTPIIDNTFFNTLADSTNYPKTEYETAINNVYNNASPAVVRISQGEINYSGLVVEKVGSEYKIITTYFEDYNNIRVHINDKNYLVKRVEKFDDQIFVSKLVIETTNQIPVYSNNLFQTNINDELEAGQTIVSIGSFDNNNINLLNKGTLSKDNFTENYEFMHDLKLNGGQIGAPIFNLAGKLIGIHSLKINELINSDQSTMIAEGLGIAFNLNSLDLNLTLNEYESSVSYESDILNTIDKVHDKVVTVRTELGHGSGVIFEKEAYQGKYRYYVLTNEHVLTYFSEITNTNQTVNEISIYFNDEKMPIRASDFQTAVIYDMAVVRFTSSENFDVVNSSVIKNQEGVNHLIGQTVIAIGTPENTNKYGYITTGIIKNSTREYDGVRNYGIHHDAALNPGNSGGPLFDLQGNLIGLNVAKITRLSTGSGTLFAERAGISLNINTIAEIYNVNFKLFEYTALPSTYRARLGVTVQMLEGFSTVTPRLLPFISENATDGIVVVDVDSLYGSVGKLKVYDVIIEMNGKVIRNNEDVALQLIDAKIGDEHIIKVLRKGFNNPITVTIEMI